MPPPCPPHEEVRPSHPHECGVANAIGKQRKKSAKLHKFTLIVQFEIATHSLCVAGSLYIGISCQVSNSLLCRRYVPKPRPLKSDLTKLAGILNQFKSELVQTKLVEMFFSEPVLLPPRC